MIIPVRCFTCNMVIGSKYRLYHELLKEKETSSKDEEVADTEEKETQHEVFDKLGLTRYCCRRHMLSHIDLVDKI